MENEPNPLVVTLLSLSKGLVRVFVESESFRIQVDASFPRVGKCDGVRADKVVYAGNVLRHTTGAGKELVFTEWLVDANLRTGDVGWWTKPARVLLQDRLSTFHNGMFCEATVEERAALDFFIRENQAEYAEEVLLMRTLLYNTPCRFDQGVSALSGYIEHAKALREVAEHSLRCAKYFSGIGDFTKALDVMRNYPVSFLLVST